MKFWFILFAFLLFPFDFCMAAVGYDAVSTATASATTSFNWTHTTSGANRAILCSATVNAALSTTSITYNSVSLTTRGTANPGGGYQLQMFGLLAPATGSNTVTVTLSGAGDSIGSCGSFTGVASFGTAVTQASGGAISTAITIPASGMGWDTVYSSDQSAGFTGGAGQTERFDVSNGAFDQSAGSTIAASTTITYNNINASYMSMVAVPMNQSVAAAVVQHRVVQ